MAEVFVNQREIWLCPFPFSDLSGKKVRPVLILSNETYNSSCQDVVVCAVTAQIKYQPYSIVVGQRNCEQGNLLHESAIKVDSLFKLNKNLLLKS